MAALIADNLPQEIEKWGGRRGERALRAAMRRLQDTFALSGLRSSQL